MLRSVRHLHDILHCVIFLATGLMFMAPVQTQSSRVRRVLTLVLFCALLELLEALPYHHAFERRDFWVDTAALCCAWLGALFLHRIHPGLPAEPESPVAALPS